MRFFAIAAALAVALSGCLDSDPVDAVTDDIIAELTAPLTSDLMGCTEHLAVVPMPAGMFDLPANFTPVAFDDLGMFDTFVAIGYECMQGNETVTEVMGAVVVEPLANDTSNATMHVYAVGGMTNSEAMLAFYESVGMPFEMAESMVMTEDLGVARIGLAVANTGDFIANIRTMVEGEVGVQEAGLARVYHSGANGLAVMDVNWTESASMMGGSEVDFGTNMPEGGAVGIGVHFWGDDYNMRLTQVLI